MQHQYTRSDLARELGVRQGIHDILECAAQIIDGTVGHQSHDPEEVVKDDQPQGAQRHKQEKAAPWRGAPGRNYEQDSTKQDDPQRTQGATKDDVACKGKKRELGRNITDTHLVIERESHRECGHKSREDSCHAGDGGLREWTQTCP